MRHKTTAKMPLRNEKASLDTSTTLDPEIALWEESDEEFMKIVEDINAEIGVCAAQDHPCPAGTDAQWAHPGNGPHGHGPGAADLAHAGKDERE